MRPAQYLPLFLVILPAFPELRDQRREWAKNLLALGPLADWADPDDVGWALANPDYGAVTDAGKLAHGIVWQSSAQDVLSLAGQLDGREDPMRSLEVFYAVALPSIKTILSVGVDRWLLSYVALALNPKDAAGEIAAALLEDEAFDFDESLPQTQRSLRRLGRAEELSESIVGFKSLQVAADQVLAEVEDEFFQERLVEDLTKTVQRELDA